MSDLNSDNFLRSYIAFGALGRSRGLDTESKESTYNGRLLCPQAVPRSAWILERNLSEEKADGASIRYKAHFKMADKQNPDMRDSVRSNSTH